LLISSATSLLSTWRLPHAVKLNRNTMNKEDNSKVFFNNGMVSMALLFNDE